MKPQSKLIQIPISPDMIPGIDAEVFSEAYVKNYFGASKFNRDMRDDLYYNILQEILSELVKDTPYITESLTGHNVWLVRYSGPETVDAEKMIYANMPHPHEWYYNEFQRRFYDRAAEAGVIE